MLIKFTDLVQTVVQPMQDTCQDLLQAAEDVSPETEIEFICSTYGTGPNQPEQLLVDYYVSQRLMQERERGGRERGKEREREREATCTCSTNVIEYSLLIPFTWKGEKGCGLFS